MKIEIGTCEECRFWEVDPDIDGECFNLVVAQKLAETIHPPKDFGCIHWEGKDEVVE